MGGTFLPQRVSDINASVQVHSVRGTISKAMKMHKLVNIQRILPQMQLKIKDGDMCVHVMSAMRMSALPIHVEGIHVCRDVHEQGQASIPPRSEM